MILKYPTYLLFLFFVHYAVGQSQAKPCECHLLEISDENDTKVLEVANAIETSLHNESTDGFIENFDDRSFFNSIIKTSEDEPIDDFTKGFLQGIKETPKNLASKLVNEIKNGTYYNLINYQYNVVEQAYYFTFRMYSEEAGINYHDYKVCTDGTQIKVNDLYIYMTGEHLSETLGRLYLLSKPKSKTQNPFKKLLGLDKPDMVENFLKAKKEADQGNFEKAYNYLNSLKGQLAREKSILLLKSFYARMFNNDLYEKVLEEFAELYPRDPTLYLKQVDYNLLRGNYDQAIHNLDELIFETEDDFVNLIKGNVFSLKEDFSSAEKSYKYMTTNYPDLFEGYVGLMVSLNHQDKFDEAITVIEKLIAKEYDVDLLIQFIEENEPDGSNALAPLIKSKAYKKWKRKL